MSDVEDGFYDYPPDDPRNPFFGLYGFDEDSIQEDPHEAIERDVLTALSIESFGGLIVTEDGAHVSEIRGNRFSDIREAILYLADAGIIAFGQVVLFLNGEIGIAIGGSP